MKILQINTHDTSSGGAEKISLVLHEYYLKKGHDSYLAVGYKKSIDKRIIQIPNRFIKFRDYIDDILAHITLLDDTIVNKIIARVLNCNKMYIVEGIRRILCPKIILDDIIGLEDFCYDGIWRIPLLHQKKYEVIHLHNPHGRYFDLSALEWLSTDRKSVV